jgi:hypothetical protein
MRLKRSSAAALTLAKLTDAIRGTNAHGRPFAKSLFELDVMHKDVARATLVVARADTLASPPGVGGTIAKAFNTQGDSIKSAQRGRLMLARGDEQLSKKIDVRMASSARKATLAAFDLLASKNASLALRKSFPDDIHRLRLADIPWSLAAPGPHGKHVASNRLRNICVPRLPELFRENRRVLPI